MADGNITVEVSTQDAQKRLLRLHRENARLRRRIMAAAVTSDAAAANVVKLAQALAESKAEVEQWRRAAQRCITAWTVVRGGVWDPNGLMDEHMAALRKALGPNAPDKRLAEGESALDPAVRRGSEARG